MILAKSIIKAHTIASGSQGVECEKAFSGITVLQLMMESSIAQHLKKRAFHAYLPLSPPCLMHGLAGKHPSRVILP